MRIQNVIFMSAILAIALLVGAATATQGNSVSIDGNGNKVDQSNTEIVHNDRAIYSSVSSSSTSTTNVYNVIGSSVATVSKPNIVMDRIVMANQVLVIEINPIANQTYIVLSGTPVAVYTIDGNDEYVVHSSESKMVYDPIYNKMDHGNVEPIDIVPYYTSYTHIKPSAEAKYLIIDNRYYAQDTEVQIGVPGSSEEL
jgi:hypothetical protein